MRRIFAVLAILLLLAGCAKEKQTLLETSNIKLLAVTEWNRQSIECEIEIDDNNFSLTVNKPQELKTLQFKWTDQQYTVSFLGMEYTPKKQSQDIYSFADVLRNAFLYSNGKMAAKDKQGYMIEGNYKNCKWQLFFDDEAIPCRLICEELGLDIKLYKKQTALN